MKSICEKKFHFIRVVLSPQGHIERFRCQSVCWALANVKRKQPRKNPNGCKLIKFTLMGKRQTNRVGKRIGPPLGGPELESTSVIGTAISRCFLRQQQINVPCLAKVKLSGCA